MFLYGNINMFDYRVFPTLTLHNIVMHHTIRVKYNVSECWNIWPCDTLQRVYSIFIWYIRKTEVLFAVCYFARYHKAPGQGGKGRIECDPHSQAPRAAPRPQPVGIQRPEGLPSLMACDSLHLPLFWGEFEQYWDSGCPSATSPCLDLALQVRPL